MIGQNLGIAPHDGDVTRRGANPESQLTYLELAEKRDMVGEGSKFALFPRRHDNVHRLAQDFPLGCHYL